MSNSVRPHRWQLTRLCHPWDSSGKNTGVGCHFLLQCMKVESESLSLQWPHGLQPTRLFHPWDFPGKSTGVGCHRLLQPRQRIKKQRLYFANKGPSSQSYGFPSSYVRMWEMDYKESWVQKNWCFRTVVLEKTFESLLDCKEIQPVHPKGNQSRIFIGRPNAKAESAILWAPDVKNWLIWKYPDAWKDWRREEKGTTMDEMVGWHHRLNGREFE